MTKAMTVAARSSIAAQPGANPPGASLDLRVAALQADVRRALELLAEIVAALAELRATVPARRPRYSAADVELARAIFAAVGARVGPAADLVDYARTPELKGAPELRAAVLAAVGALSIRCLGKRLRKLEGVALGGLQVVREGADREGALWSMRECGS